MIISTSSVSPWPASRLTACISSPPAGAYPTERPRPRRKPNISMSQEIPDTKGNPTISPISGQGSNAPLVHALKAYAEQDVACFHFPGHNRGKAVPSSLSQITGPGIFLHDPSPHPEVDNLFYPKGAILDAQRKAAELFGSSETWFQVGGSTCGVEASIMATCSPGEMLILPRNSHLSATSGLVLSGALPKYIIPEYNPLWDIPGGITVSQVQSAIKELEEDGRRAAAVLITSPTYHGICSNVREITELCHSYGIPVIVDEAHGAHFLFHAGFPCSALEQGADLVVQSTHKVLCSLSQSSMLHSLGNIVDRDRISRCLQTLQSSSPSYLLLASLDAARAQLSENPNTLFNRAMDLSIQARNRIRKIPGVSVLSLTSFPSGFPAIDPLRLTLGVSMLGVSGYTANEILCKKRHVMCELAGSRSLTFVINLGTSRKDIDRLLSGIKHLSAKTSFYQGNGGATYSGVGVSAPFTDITMRLSPREAFFAKKRKAGIEECAGEVCGELVFSFPPGIPVLVPGEVITEEALSYLLDVHRTGGLIKGAADCRLTSFIVCKL